MTITITIAGSPISLKESTLQLRQRVDDKDTCTFTVTDTSGTLAFNKGQPVSVTDSVLGTLFTGYVNKPTATNLYPDATNEWSIDCVNQFYVAAKKATTATTGTKKHRGGKHVKQPAGAIVANQIQEYLEPDGVSGNFGLDWSELQTDWSTGTLTGTTAATNTSTGNPSAGDLELAPTGTSVTFQQSSQADFGVGSGLQGAVGGGLIFTPTPAIKLTATQALPGVSGSVLKVLIWSGSYTIAASDDLFFDVWIADSSPQQMASMDLVFTDGTTMSLSQAAIGTDIQQVGPGLANDLSGLATNQWYTRRFFLDAGGAWVGKALQYVAVCFGGSSQGNYTAYFRNAYILNGSTTKLTIFSTSATATQSTPQPVVNGGYTTVACSVVTTYERTGTLNSPSYSLTSAGVAQSSILNWTINLPDSNFTYAIIASLDGSSTFLPCTSGQAIPGLLAGMNLSGVTLTLEYIFQNNGNDPTLTPLLSSLSGVVNPTYSCVKADIINTNKGSTAWNAGTLTNLVLSGSNTIQLNGYARNWDNADYSNQTLYGSSSPAQGVLKKQFFLTSGAAADARSRFDFAGSSWQNFTMEVDITLLAGNTGVGFVYRTTGWGNSNDSYAYSVTINTTQALLARGSNSSGAGSFTSINTTSITLSVNTTYRLKVIVNGSSHQVYLNNILIISATDSTYSTAGYVGLRLFNNAGSTQTAIFDNFGIMASLTGQWVSPVIDLHGLQTISNSQAILQIDPLVNTSIVMFLVEISLNNGSTWTSCPNDLTTQVVLGSGYYQTVPVPGLTSGTNVSTYTQVKLRLTITSSTAATGSTMPDIQAVSLFLVGFYNSIGIRSTAPVMWDSMIRGNVASGFGTATNGALYTQTGTGTTSLTSNEALISNTTGDVQMSVGASYKATVLADSPIRYYRLDDTNTTAVDIGSQAHNGTLNGAIIENRLGLLAGDSDTAMSFDGSTGYISLPTTSLPTGASPWTLECWCNFSAFSAALGYGCMVTMGSNGTQQAGILAVHNISGLYYFVLVTISGDIQASVAVNPGVTYHLVGTYDGSSTRLYVNGILVAGPTAFTLNLGNSAAAIGTRFTDFFFPGVLDEVAIYSTALSAAKILAHYNAGVTQIIVGDTDEMVRFKLSTSTISAGTELRYASSTNVYRCKTNTSTISLLNVTNNNSTTLATSSVSLSTGVFYWMRFRAVSSNPASLYARVWQDGTSEPTTWNVTATDNGYIQSSDTFTRANQSGWGTASDGETWGVPASNPGTDTLSITGNHGQVASNSGSIGNRILLGTNTLLHVNALVRITVGSTSDGTGIFVRSDALALNQYLARLVPGSTTSVEIDKRVNGGLSALGTFSTGVTLSAGMAVWMRFVAIGSTLSIKVWQDGTSEPTAYAGSVTDSTYIGTGQYGLYCTAAPASPEKFDSFSVTGLLVSGSVALFGNGTGTASFDTFRATNYPDPSVSLVNAGRAVNSLVNWNGNIPTSTNVEVQTSVDNGVTWQPIANANDPIPLIATLAYYSAVRSDSPVAFYRLNEKSGIYAYDSSNNNYSGTLNGGVTEGQTSLLQGMNESTDTCMLFDGSSGYISLPSTFVPTGASPWSLECWCKITAIPVTGVYAIMGMGKDASQQGALLTLTSNGTNAQFICSTYNGDITSSNISINTVYHVVGTYDGTDTRLYVNAILAAGPTAFTCNLVATYASIGAHGATITNFFAGTIQGAAFYTSTLSSTRITAHYNAGTTATQSVYNDSFTANTSAQYTQTNGTGGSGATWTWDTANSRISAVGGSKAVLLWTIVSTGDIDMLVDLYQSENSGIVWGWQNASNYYELVVKDSGAVSGANTMTLNKISGGSSSQLATGSISFTTQTHHRVHMTMLSGVITAYLDGTQILTYTDGSPFSGQAGLRNDTGTSYIYLLQITPQMPSISNMYLCVKQTLLTNIPTSTPQITDHQALVSDSTLGIGATIPSADYSNSYVSDNVDDLNTKSNYWWQVGSGAVTFQARNAVDAPWIMQSTDILTGTLPTVEYSGDMYRNEQVLKGVIQTSIFSQQFVGDGQSRTWNVANPIVSVPTISLNGVVQTVGLQGIDTGKAYYWQNNSTSITQDNSQTILRNGIDVLTVAYQGSYGITFTLDNTGQISNTISQSQLAATDNTSGIVAAIEDVSSQNMNVAAATNYANQLLQRYGSIARTIVFTTLHSGLQKGQSLPIFIPELNIFDSVFLVVEITTSIRSVSGGQQFIYTVTASEAAALSSWSKYFAKVLRSVTGTKSKV